MFSGLWWVFSLILDFIWLDALLFIKVVKILFHHTSRKLEHFVSLESNTYLAPSSGFWTWWVFSSVLHFTCLDAVLFVKVAYSLLHHSSTKRKHFVSLKYNSHLAPSSGLWIFSWILDFACLDAVLFVKVAQTWLHHALRKRKHFTSLKCKKFFAPISVFWTLVSAFLKTWFHLSWRSFVFKSCSDIVAAQI